MDKKWVNTRDTLCKCGDRLTHKNIEVPLLGMKTALGYYEDNFYGGSVTKFSKTKHSCGREVLLYLRQVGEGFVVHDVAFLEPEEDIETPEPIIDNEEEAEISLDKLDKALNNEEEDKATHVNPELQFVTSFLAGNLEEALDAFKNIQFAKCADALAEVGFDRATEVLVKGKNQSRAVYIEMIKSRLLA